MWSSGGDGVGHKASTSEFLDAHFWQLGWHSPLALPASVRCGLRGPQRAVGSQREDWNVAQAAHVD
eukprot:1626894-Pyramimonas_sp.AAC.1